MTLKGGLAEGWQGLMVGMWEVMSIYQQQARK